MGLLLGLGGGVVLVRDGSPPFALEIYVLQHDCSLLGQVWDCASCWVNISCVQLPGGC